jgi:superfamily II DNA or RNA helicase
MTAQNLSQIDLKISYQTDVDDPINEFYLPCLNNSIEFFRAVGYFRSSIFLITGESIIDFVKRGGKINLICSPELTQQDMDAIASGKASLESLTDEYIEYDIETMLEQSEENYAIKVLATLIKVKALEVKIALKELGSGIYHAKTGVFRDPIGNQVSFIGSANETWSAWDPKGNHEIIEVFCSWRKDAERVQKHMSDFDRLWHGLTPGVKTIQFPEAMEKQLIRVALNSIDDVDLSKLKKTNIENKAKKKINDLFTHQKNALENWKLNNYRGIFQHATGSGKTVTALKAIDDHLRTGGVAIVLVPSSLLLSQWTSELKREIDNLSLLLAGSGNTKWKSRLKYFVSQPISETSRVVLSTMQTASSDDFINAFKNVQNLLIVGDEVHQIGSDKNSKSMQIDALKRLGLSATPQRYGDPEGTAKIIEYFGKIIEPVFTLVDAIKGKRLVEYEYFPHLINLTAKEAEQWKIETEKIKKEVAITNNNQESFFLSARAKMLLIQRSRIAKKSKAKLNLVERVIRENYEIGQKWLIYCEDIDQLRDVKKIIQKLDFDVYEYYSEMSGDGEQTLNLYQHRGGILVSIKCLDEGVDIPSISHALIIASSQNPRQFIQRRGRVLRVYGDIKKYAVIHDALIVPIDVKKEPDQVSLLKSEMTRAFEFADYALNSTCKNELKLKAIELGIDLNDIINDGLEDDDNSDEEALQSKVKL